MFYNEWKVNIDHNRPSEKRFCAWTKQLILHPGIHVGSQRTYKLLIIMLKSQFPNLDGGRQIDQFYMYSRNWNQSTVRRTCASAFFFHLATANPWNFQQVHFSLAWPEISADGAQLCTNAFFCWDCCWSHFSLWRYVYNDSAWVHVVLSFNFKRKKCIYQRQMCTYVC